MASMLDLVLQAGRKAQRIHVAEGQQLALLIGHDVLDSAVQEMCRRGGFSFLDIGRSGESMSCYGVRIVRTQELGQLSIALLWDSIG